MARRRVDTAPQFNVGADSVLIQQVVGSTSNIFEVKNHSGASVMAIDSSGATTATFAAGVGLPVGMITPFAGSTAPTGWFLCGGQAVSRTTYASLFAVVGTTYGAGDGSTTFNLPDLRGRAVAGVDNMGGTDAGRLDIANSSGTVIGSQYVTLTSAQSGVPAHSHANTVTNNAVTSGAGSAHTHTQNSHGHSFTPRYGGSTAVGVNMDVNGFGSPYGLGGGYVEGATATNQNESAHTHSVTSNVTISNQQNTAANAAESHSVMQPTMVLNYIVRY
jgi:microcystin-dependent protein